MKLASAAPTGGIEYLMYQAPNLVEVNIDSITVCNRAATGSNIRISTCNDSTVTTSTADYVVYDFTIPANETVPIAVGISLYSGQTLRVYSDFSNMSFTAFGKEVKSG